MKKLPLGIQTFKKIINDNCLYVDKTKDIHRLITSGDYIFISRPRRFGKSLLVSTIKEIFSGNKELFKDLYIYDKIKWEKYPVIHIDFTDAVYSESKEVFIETLINKLIIISEEYGIKLEKKKYLKETFIELIKKLSEINKVAILIDEYDKPIIDHITDMEKPNENRELLRDFYSVLKSCDPYIKFVFLTGVTKFSRVSIFSGLNNLRDITLEKDFSSIMGITGRELEKYFKEHINNLKTEKGLSEKELLNRIKCWYDGYSWDGIAKLYNPFSILNLFASKSFKNYWFATGTTAFLIKLIKENKCEITEFENKKISETILDSYDIENMNIYSLLFQTGYLTVSSVEREEGFIIYNLKYPNKEVRDAFNTFIIESFTDNRGDEIEPKIIALKRALRKENIEEFINIIKSMFAKIPYTLHIPAESYYHSLFYMILSLMGVRLDMEVITDKGRIDGVLEFQDKIYVFEFKYGNPGSDMNRLKEKAVEQIKEKKYYERFLKDKKKVFFLGVGFIDKEIDYKLEKM